MVTSDFQISQEKTTQGLLVHASGELYLDTAGELRDALFNVVSNGLYPRVIVDLREIGIMDSSGIAAILNARKRTAEGLTEFRVLVALGSQPHRVLAAAGLIPHLGVIFELNVLTDCE